MQEKYALVKHHDRVGRMTDILEYSDVAFPRERFSPELLAELEHEAPSQVERDGDRIVVRHVYIERRLTPLNLYLQKADAWERARALREYGDAIAQLAARQHLRRRPPVQELRRDALRPRGVLRLRRDRVPHRLPLPPHPAAAARLRRDVRRRVVCRWGRATSSPRSSRRSCSPIRAIREAFLRHHANLLDAQWWQPVQHSIASGELPEVLSYPESARFRDRHAAPAPAAS